MFEFFKSVVPYITPIFVISTMLNVGLTQKLSDVIQHLKNYPFVLRMLIANFVAAPLLMILILYFAPFESALKAGLLIYSLCAGAPFLVKLTQMAEQKAALGAAVMILLSVVTVAYVPLVLPWILSGLTVDAWAVAKTLVLQMLLPIIAGMIVLLLLPDFTRKVRPWVSLFSNVALCILVVAILIGYSASILTIVGTGAILVSLFFGVAAFGIGDLMGVGKDHLQDVGGLATAQRNAAAATIIAVQNFSAYSDVLVMITLANILGIIMLMFIARHLGRDKKETTETVFADRSRISWELRKHRKVSKGNSYKKDTK